MARVAFISAMEVAPWGGSEALWSEAALRLREQGCNVAVSVKGWPATQKRISALEQAGCDIQRRYPASRPRRIVRKLLPRQFDWLTRFRPELVVLSLSNNREGVAWMLACAKRKLRYTLIIQAASDYDWPDDEDAAALAQGYEGAEACFFVSEGNLQLTRMQLATPLPKASVVRNPFNVSYDAHPVWPQDDGILHLACVGRLEPFAKGQDILFRVLAQEKWRQREVQVTLLGNGIQSGILRKMKETLSLDSVTFAGFTSDIEGFWASHHALVLPSRSEGLPIAVVEAMLCGRPCIVTDIAGNAELIEDERSGFVAAGPTVKALDEALERAWSRKKDLKEIGQRAAQEVRKLVPRDPGAVLAKTLAQIGQENQ